MFATIGCLGFNLVARIVAGKCPHDTSFWETQRCTPFVSSVPSDIIMVLYIIPFVFIMFTAIKSVSIFALIFSWCLIIGFVTFSIVYNNAWSQIWELYNSAFFIAFTFMVERHKRIAFLRLVEVKEQKMNALNLQKKHMEESASAEQRRLLEVASVTAANERKLRVTETQLLRSLMGNVAHDLKTPLFSIEADVELLQLIFNTIPPQSIQKALASMSMKTSAQNVDLNPSTIFESLWSTSRFMIAAINRCQDYAKTSMNVALVPSQGTIEVYKTMATATRCVRHLLSSDASLVCHPLPSNLCDFIITDGHWLLENMLCLLSNAIKYSSSGTTSLTIELVQEGMEPLGTTVVRLDEDGIPIAPSGSELCSVPNNIASSTMVLVIVEDEGVGVSAEVRQTLFQPFKQAQRLAGGTGLGLFSLCKRVEALGGKCGCMERRDGRPGSLFWFTFPYRSDDTALTNVSSRMQSRKTSNLPNVTMSLSSILETSLSPQGDPPPSAFLTPRTTSSLDEVQPNGASKKILLLDDTPSIIKVVGRLLQTNGHMVDTAINGHQGLEKLKRSYLTKDTTISSDIDSSNACQYIGYDLVLSDLQMPVLDGLEFTKRFRVWEEEQQCILEAQGLPRRNRFLIIGMSANCDEQTKQETVQAGMDHFIGKPFNYVDLEAILECHDIDMLV